MDGDRLIPISALQHYSFCPRQCALIHNEQLWEENWLTAQGQLLHQRVDGGSFEVRKGTRFERGVRVRALSLGLTGKLDLVEIDLSSGNSQPVEYKRGQSKIDDCDRVQLCAQALCLEEMGNKTIPYGWIWYAKTRKRERINFNSDLREKTKILIKKVKILFKTGITPLAKYGKKCKACSLIEFCKPKVTSTDSSKKYIQNLFTI
ncbi:CRISPR-associated protein Cas4 [Candidatus Riflebacteria bacterium]